MERPNWMDRIVVDPKLHGGEPCIKGTRIPVSMIVGSIADGDTVEVLLGDIRTYVPGTYVGIVLLRADEESRRNYLELASATVRSLRLEEFPGCLVVVTPRGIRIRAWSQ